MSLSFLKSQNKNQQTNSAMGNEESGDFRAANQFATGRTALKIGSYPYRLQHELGQTNMSCTWRALEKNRAVVLKIARWDQDDQFKRNQRAIDNEEHWLRLLQGSASGEHGAAGKNSLEGNRAGDPGLVELLPIAGSGQRPIYSAKTEENGNPRFISLVYMPGGSLQSLVQNGGKVPVKQALYILYRLAETLRYVHRHGCVHLDIKPDNIMFRQTVTGESELKDVEPTIIDFGIAGEMATRQYVGGVARWLSPECLVAKESVEKLILHPGMDIYPLGLILHYMLTGVLPKPNVRPAPIEPAMLRRDPTVPKRHQKQLAHELTQFIQMMLVRDLDKRPRAKVVSHYARRLMQERTDAKVLGQVDKVQVDKRKVDKAVDKVSVAETEHTSQRRVEKPLVTKRLRLVGVMASMLGVLILSGILLLESGTSPSTKASSVPAKGEVVESLSQAAVVQEVAVAPPGVSASAALITAAQVVTVSVDISTAIDVADVISPTAMAALSPTNSAALDSAVLDSVVFMTDTITNSVATGATNAPTMETREAISVTNSLPISPTLTNNLANLSTKSITATGSITATDLLTGTDVMVESVSITETTQLTSTQLTSTQLTATPSITITPEITATRPSTTTESGPVQPTDIANPTATPMPTFTTVPTHTPLPTSTLIPIQSTATTAAIPLLTPIETSTSVALIASPTSTATPPVLQVIVPATPTPSLLNSVALIQPANGVEGVERVDFVWKAHGELASNEHFEVAFWKAGQDPYNHAFGVTGAGTYTNITVNLRKLALNRSDLLISAQDYLWGVWIVRASDGERLRLVSEVRTIYYDGASKSGSN